MGTAYSASSAVGAPPHYNSLAFYGWLERLLNLRLSECPVARGTTKYGRYNAAGSATGGTGDGSLATPWLFATPAHINSLIHNAAKLSQSGDWALLLADGDTFNAPTGGTGIVMDIPNTMLGRYRPAGSLAIQEPAIDAYKAAYGAAGWTQHGTQTNLYYRVDTDAVKWIREDTNPDHALRRVTTATSLATMNGAAYAGSWQKDVANTLGLGANTVIMHPRASGGTAPPATTQASVGTGRGVHATADGVRVDGLRADGWGMQTAASQNYGFTSGVTGTDCCLFSNCTSYWNSTHGPSHYTSGSGGIATFVACRGGLCMADNTGDSSVFNGYASGGGAEILQWGCNPSHGGLKDETFTSQWLGKGVFSHSDGTAHALHVAVDTVYPRAGSAFGLESASSATHMPAAANRDDWAPLRGFFVNDQAPELGVASAAGGGATIFAPQFCRVDGSHTYKATTGMSTTAFQTGNSGGGPSANFTLRMDATPAAAPTVVAFLNTGGTDPYMSLTHCRVEFMSRDSGQTLIFGYSAGPASGGLAVNTVFVHTGDGTCRVNYTANQTPGAATVGGYTGCCFGGIRVDDAFGGANPGYNLSQAPVTLPAAELLAAPTAASDAGYINAAGTDPRGGSWTLEHDALRRRRPTFRAPTSAGPVERGRWETWY